MEPNCAYAHARSKPVNAELNTHFIQTNVQVTYKEYHVIHVMSTADLFKIIQKLSWYCHSHRNDSFYILCKYKLPLISKEPLTYILTYKACDSPSNRSSPATACEQARKEKHSHQTLTWTYAVKIYNDSARLLLYYPLH